MIDTTTKLGRRVAQRLRDERIIWLTTVGRDLTPQPRPVWFYWDGSGFLIFSKPDTHKVDHITLSPKVALHLDGDGLGGDIVVITGNANIQTDIPSAEKISAYVEKYQEGFKRIGVSPDAFGKTYSVAIHVVPTNLRGH